TPLPTMSWGASVSRNSRPGSARSLPINWGSGSVSKSGPARPKTRPMLRAALDIPGLRRDFPILRGKVNGNPLVYLDNAAASQAPRQVVEAIVYYYKRY